MTAKRGSEIKVGDIIMFLGTPHRVASLTPYTHPVMTEGAPGWRTARAADGWGITLSPQILLEVE